MHHPTTRPRSPRSTCRRHHGMAPVVPRGGLAGRQDAAADSQVKCHSRCGAADDRTLFPIRVFAPRRSAASARAGRTSNAPTSNLQASNARPRTGPRENGTRASARTRIRPRRHTDTVCRAWHAIGHRPGLARGRRRRDSQVQSKCGVRHPSTRISALSLERRPLARCWRRERPPGRPQGRPGAAARSLCTPAT